MPDGQNRKGFSTSTLSPQLGRGESADCPRHVAPKTAGIFGAWETEKQVHFGLMNPDTGSGTDIAVSHHARKKKYPSLPLNREVEENYIHAIRLMF